MKVVILGIGGMIGSQLFYSLSQYAQLDVLGTLRSPAKLKYFPASLHPQIRTGIDVTNNIEILTELLVQEQPDIVVNCIGIIKQTPLGNDPRRVIPINALLPHQLAEICEKLGSRLIHVSTDCVFSGNKGNYAEDDAADARDLYGLSRCLGEPIDGTSLTIRTSLIGHELDSNYGLLEWFLAQTGTVSGYSQAIFSGISTLEFARVLQEYIFPNTQLQGMYHLAGEPIAKFDLLNIIKDVYAHPIMIQAEHETVIDRSLNATRFAKATGYRAPFFP